MRPAYELKQKQSLPLRAKLSMTAKRIDAWLNWCVENDRNTYVSFSGGLDSTVLLDIVRRLNGDSTKAVFCNTGLESRGIVSFVNTVSNTTVIQPKMGFKQVVAQYGYPLISKEVAECVRQAKASLIKGDYTYRLAKLYGTAVDEQGRKSLYNIENYRPLLKAPFKISGQCCEIMKKQPFKEYNKHNKAVPFIGTMAEESRGRATAWRKTGCNAFSSKDPHSMPLSFWTRQDILGYILYRHLDYAKSVYGDIIEKKGKLITTKAQRTGCEFCLFGAHCKDDRRFLILKNQDRKRYDYIMGGGDFDSEGCWIPNNKGLGYWFIFEWAEKNLGIKYKV